eukprot:CAMPEP_0194512540 /NCGR_PEP_ID=MMETSP0253-20130528/44557_1 /TAXON_ID=2966 /ORGANISM="Noctiluca scintillans" /LENGTH=42 /DNA_ID= /DNA_START= /DNA_END= /DNA_ORIENTATION=
MASIDARLIAQWSPQERGAHATQLPRRASVTLGAPRLTGHLN